MYQAKVNVTTKGRKHNLPVKSGDTVNIIRTDFCPKGKWLARDSSNNCKLKTDFPASFSSVYLMKCAVQLREQMFRKLVMNINRRLFPQMGILMCNMWNWISRRCWSWGKKLPATMPS